MFGCCDFITVIPKHSVGKSSRSTPDLLKSQQVGLAQLYPGTESICPCFDSIDVPGANTHPTSLWSATLAYVIYASSEPIEIVPLENKPDVTVPIPGSKSHTNRALICAALADGRSGLEGALFADDTQALLSALLTLGMRVYADPEGSTITVFGCGGEIPEGPADVDVRMSGTASRFIMPMLALGVGPYRVDGHPTLRDRPFEDLTAALRSLGATVEGDSLPLEISGRGLKGGQVSVPGNVSSQFLSGLLLSAPYTRMGLVIEVTGNLVSKPYIDLTIATMAQFGVSAKETDLSSLLRGAVATTPHIGISISGPIRR